MLRMKTKSAICSGVAAVVGFGMMAASTAALSVTLDQVKDRGFARVAVANEIPYGYVDASGDAKGAGPDVAEAVLNSMGIDDIQWTVTNFGSLIPAVKANRVDLVAAEMAILPERCKAVDYSAPNSTYGEGLMVAEGNPKGITSFDVFAENEDLTVAIMSGADQLEIMQALGVPQSQMLMVNANTDAIAAVATGRADAYAATGLTAYNLSQKSDKVQFVDDFQDPVVDGEVVRSWGGFVFDESSDSFRMAFNKALKKFKKTDEWANILHSYGFNKTDTSASFDKSTKELCGDGYDASEG